MKKFVPTIRFRLYTTFGMPALLAVVSTTASVLQWTGALQGAGAVKASHWLVLGCNVTCVVLLTCGCVHLHGIVADGLGRQSRGFRYLSESLDLTRRSAARRMDEFGRGAVVNGTQELIRFLPASALQI